MPVSNNKLKQVVQKKPMVLSMEIQRYTQSGLVGIWLVQNNKENSSGLAHGVTSEETALELASALGLTPSYKADLTSEFADDPHPEKEFEKCQSQIRN